MKKCTKCCVLLPLNMFGRHKLYKDGLRFRCKPCEAADRKEAKQKELELDYEGTRLKERANNLKRMFNITPEEWELKADAQKYKCAICKNSCSTGKRLAVDHDHDTGKIRDLLCGNCNQGLGKFLDNPQLLDEAAEYLRRHGRT